MDRPTFSSSLLLALAASAFAGQAAMGQLARLFEADVMSVVRNVGPPPMLQQNAHHHHRGRQRIVMPGLALGSDVLQSKRKGRRG